MKLWKKGLALTLAVLMTGCAGSTAYQKAKDDEAVGHWDMAVMNYAKALELNPENAGYKAALARAKLKASQVHFEKGKMYRASGRPDLAVVELSQTVLLDPTNQYAEDRAPQVRGRVRQAAEERTAETKIEGLKKKTEGARASTADARAVERPADQPELPAAQAHQADLPGARRRLRDQRPLRSAAQGREHLDRPDPDEFQEALETLMRAGNHFYKVIDEHTILIAADTPQNRRTYEDLVIQTFFLSNAEVRGRERPARAAATTRIAANKAENAIILRDTADKVAVAERIIEANDKQRPRW